MPDWMSDWPVLAVFGFFLFGAIARSQVIYWMGRGVAAGVLRSRWRERLDSPRVHRATRHVERWGMPIVPFAFLTIGFQSAVFAAVGLLRVHWLRYTIWTIPGALVWAAIWGGGGFAVVRALWELAQTAQGAFVVAVVLLVGGGLAALLLLRRRREQRDAVDALGDLAEH